MNKKESERIEMIMKQLQEGVNQVYETDQWKLYLKVMSRFHTYSSANTILIYKQKRDATYVAGYQTWKNKFKRYVKKGEKAIHILAPVHKVVEEDKEGEKKYRIIGFRPVNVFDISQTSGQALPAYMSSEMEGTVMDYDNFIQKLMSVSPVPVQFGPLKGSMHGCYNPISHSIIIQDSMSEIQTVKTLLHEITHALLHGSHQSDLPREVKEIEAESTAYAVCSYFHIDTSEYSFPYIAGWSQDCTWEDLKPSLDSIRYASDYLITSIKNEQFCTNTERSLLSAGTTGQYV